MRVIITGIAGFVGSYLTEFLLQQGNVEVFGIEKPGYGRNNIERIKGKIYLKEFDLQDFSSVEKAVKEIRPDKIFHLAAQAFVPTSWNSPAETLTTNIIGQLNIFEAVKSAQINPWIQIAGSAEEYGMVYPDELPVNEDSPLRPLSPYGVSKVAQDLLGYQYFMSYQLNIVRTRAFNHIGPRQNESFVTSNFAKQIAEIEKGKRKIVEVGNLDARRDFTDVRDIVCAYWLATEKSQPGEVYNICSGKSRSVKEILDTLIGMAKTRIEIKEDSTRLRPSDIPVLIGDSTKFCQRTGWRPLIPLEKTLQDLLNYWREKV